MLPLVDELKWAFSGRPAAPLLGCIVAMWALWLPVLMPRGALRRSVVGASGLVGWGLGGSSEDECAVGANTSPPNVKPGGGDQRGSVGLGRRG